MNEIEPNRETSVMLRCHARLLMVFISLVVAALDAPQARATSIPTLGQAGNYAVFGLDAGSQGTTINLSNVYVTGNVGVSQYSTLQLMAPSTINGNVSYDLPSTLSYAGTLTGTSSYMNLSTAVTDAYNASSQAAALTPTQTVGGNITSNTTFTRSAAATTNGAYLNVVNVSGGINLNNANITLKGNASDYFVVNVSGNLSLTGTASLLLDGVTADHVMYNFTGGSSTTPGTFNTHVGDVVNGTMLAPYYNMNLDGTWNGELIGGISDISLLSGATVTQESFAPPSTTPEPPAGVLALIGSIGLGLASLIQRLRRTVISAC